MLSSFLIFGGLGALGAGLGYLLSAVIFADRDAHERPKWPAAIGIGLSVLIARPIVDWVDRPTVDTVMHELETQQPVFALLREHEPQAYAQFRAMVAPMVANGRPDADVAAREGRAIFSAVMVRRSMAASGPLIDEIIDLTIDQAVALQRYPRVCADLLTGRAGDVRCNVSADLQQREARLQARLFQEPAAPEQTIMPDQELEQVMTDMLPVLAQASGLSPDRFAQAMQGLGDPAEACRAGRIFFEEIKKLPPPRRVSLYRRLMQEALAAPQAPTI